MKLPFIKDDTKDVEKRKLHKVIEREAWEISKKMMTHRLKPSDVDRLEGLYKEYYDKYPDADKELKCMKMIVRLRTIIGDGI